MPLVILHHLLNVFVQLANKRGFTKKKKELFLVSSVILTCSVTSCATIITVQDLELILHGLCFEDGLIE
jgi:hypothetical protein